MHRRMHCGLMLAGALLGAAAASAEPSKEAEALAHLQAGPWTIEITSLGAAGKPATDTLTFEGRKLASKRFGGEGYPSSNITVNVGDDGVPVWETMQTKEGGGVTFWRGELHGSSMRGIISKHPIEGPSVDFSFKGTGPAAPALPAAVTQKAPVSAPVMTTPAVPAAPAEGAAEPAAKSAAPAASEAPAPKKKRKGWF